jgi:hypothetical protein
MYLAKKKSDCSAIDEKVGPYFSQRGARIFG